MNRWLQVAIAFLISLDLPSSNAAQFTTHCDAEIEKTSGCTIRMSGQIVPGDAGRFASALGSVPTSPGFYRTLVLSSPGGDVAEALKIAELVRRAVLETSNYRIGPYAESPSSKPGKFDRAGSIEAENRLRRENFHQCVSACFVVWAAGAKREQVSDHFLSKAVPGSGTVKYGLGLHRPFFTSEAYQTSDPATIAKKQQDITEALRLHLRREAIPDQLIEEMMRRSSREVLWLDATSDEPGRDISVAAPWFEELLIARCSYDPARDREMTQQVLRYGLDPSKKPLHFDRLSAEYLAWIQGVNSCRYDQIVIPAQIALRR